MGNVIYFKYGLFLILLIFQFSCTSGLILLERCCKIELDLNEYNEKIQNLILASIDPSSLVLCISLYSADIYKFKETYYFKYDDLINRQYTVSFEVFPAAYKVLIMLCKEESVTTEGLAKFNLLNYDFVSLSIESQEGFNYETKANFINFLSVKLDCTESIVINDKIIVEYCMIGIENFEKFNKGKLYLLFGSGESVSKSIYANGTTSKTEYNSIDTFISWIQFNTGYFLNKKSCSFDIEITTKINKDMLQKDFYKMYAIENIYIPYPKYAIGTFDL